MKEEALMPESDMLKKKSLTIGGRVSISREIRTLVFDWDGTLHQTHHLYGEAVRSVYRDLVRSGEAPEHWYSDEDLSIYLGMNALDMWAAFLPQLPEKRWLEMSRRVGEHMVSLIRSGEACLYPGAEHVLDRLREEGFRMVLLSNCTIAYMDAHREHFRLNRWFDGYYPCEAWGNIPKEEIFPQIREAFPANFCIIGDRASDLKAAKIHGIPSIACAWGYGKQEEFATATAVASSLQNLPEIIHTLLPERSFVL